MCELAEISRSSFYAWLGRVPSAREVVDTDLLKHIIEIHTASRRTYGAPRVLGQLRHAGWRVSEKRVARLMAANGLVGRVSDSLCRRR